METACELSPAEKFNSILNEMLELYRQKNKAYDDSFSRTYREEGSAAARIRLSDKLSRYKTLTKLKPEVVNPSGESVRDTLIDLACYAVMTIMEIDRYDDV